MSRVKLLIALMLHVRSVTPDDPAIGNLHTAGENVAPGERGGGGDSSIVAAESPECVNHLEPSLQRTLAVAFLHPAV